MALDSQSEQDSGIVSVETLTEYEKKGYKIQSVGENPRGMTEYAIWHEGQPLLRLEIDHRGDIEASLRTNIDKKRFTEIASGLLRFTSEGEQSPPNIFEDGEMVSVASPESDVHCLFSSDGSQNPLGDARISVVVPNNRRLDRDMGIMRLVGFIDSAGEDRIPRPLIHSVVASAKRESEKIPPRE